MPATSTGVWSDTDYHLTPGNYADLYSRASSLIGQLGYNPGGENYEGERGISIETALQLAAESVTGLALPEAVAEEALTRLVGMAYLLGILKRRSNVMDLTDELSGWECRWTTYVGIAPSEDAARELLATAARTLRGMHS